MAKKQLKVNVHAAAVERIKWTFDTFDRICVSFSGGKDSTVMTHLVMDEAIKRNRRVGLFFVDMEGQYKHTVDHLQEMYDLYADHIEPYWVCLPLTLRNAVSQYEQKWTCWEPGREADWIRPLPEMGINDQDYFPFYEYAMEFEEFVPEFNKWYADGKLTASIVAIRSDESLNRYRTIASRKKSMFENMQWTTWCGEGVYNIYPIYDWRTRDIWIYNSKFNKPYNKVYDLMQQAGLSIHQARLCQPYGDDQRKGLWLFQVLEPETWARIVARVNGANQGALYARESGNILGNIKVTKPEGHTWESFAKMLLASMPDSTREHYENKILVFLKWFADRGYPYGIPDDGPIDKGNPNWKRICKALLRNDYWCKGLSFTQTKSDAYEKYKKVMKRRRQKWGISI